MTAAQIVGIVGMVLMIGGFLVSIAVMIGQDEGFWAGVGFLAAILGGTGLLMLLAGMATGEIG